MKKLEILVVIILLTLLNACSNGDKEIGIDYDIDDDSTIEVVYYEKFSEDQSTSQYDTLVLNLTNDQFLSYSFFNEVLAEASKVSYDENSIILGIPIGTYEIKIIDHDSFGVTIQFKQIGNNTYEFVIYKTENGKAFEQYIYEQESSQELNDFINFVQENGLFRQIS